MHTHTPDGGKHTNAFRKQNAHDDEAAVLCDGAAHEMNNPADRGVQWAMGMWNPLKESSLLLPGTPRPIPQCFKRDHVARDT